MRVTNTLCLRRQHSPKKFTWMRFNQFHWKESYIIISHWNRIKAEIINILNSIIQCNNSNGSWNLFQTDYLILFILKIHVPVISIFKCLICNDRMELGFKCIVDCVRRWHIVRFIDVGDGYLERNMMMKALRCWWPNYTKISIISTTSSNCHHYKVNNNNVVNKITLSYIQILNDFNHLDLSWWTIVNPKLEYFDDQNESTSLKTLSKSAWQSI